DVLNDTLKGELWATSATTTNHWTSPPQFCGHIDFDHVNSCSGTPVALGLVQTTLSAQGKPQFNSRLPNAGTCTTSSASPYTSNFYQLSDAARFNQWYVTTPLVNKEIGHNLALVLTSAQTRTYEYNSACNTFTSAATCGLANGCVWGGTTCGSA